MFSQFQYSLTVLASEHEMANRIKRSFPCQKSTSGELIDKLKYNNDGQHLKWNSHTPPNTFCRSLLPGNVDSEAEDDNDDEADRDRERLGRVRLLDAEVALYSQRDRCVDGREHRDLDEGEDPG